LGIQNEKIMTREKTKSLNRKKSGKTLNRDAVTLILMVVPWLVYLVLFQYAPLYGILLPFKDYTYTQGIWGSAWAGLRNFEFLFTSPDFATLLLRSIGYNVLFIILGTIAKIMLAFAFYSMKNKGVLKYCQTTMLLPHFMSIVVVAYTVYGLLDPRYGILSTIFGKEMEWYSHVQYWPFILTIVHIWKSVGLDAIIYYAALMGIDAELFDAAAVEGASKWQQKKYICLPCIKNLIVLLLMFSVAAILNNDFGLFYQVPMNVTTLYPATDVIETYVFRGLRTGDLSMTAAVGLFQSVVGVVLLVGVNFLIRKVDPESALF